MSRGGGVQFADDPSLFSPPAARPLVLYEWREREREKERKRERGVGGRGGVGSGRRKNADFGSMIGHDHSYQGSTAWTFQGIHERAFILALQSWLAKVASYQPGLAFVELNKPGYTEEDLASLDLA